MNFWLNVEAERAKQNISTKALAEAAGVTVPAISKYRAGAVPNLVVAAKIAAFLGVSLDWLVWGNVGSPPRSVCESPEEHGFIREFLQGWSVKDLVMLAGLSPKEAEWCILEALVKQHPSPVSRSALRERLPQLSDSTLDATLLSLERCATVKSLTIDHERYYTSVNNVPIIPGAELRDVALNLTRAIGILLKHVFAAQTARVRRGHLITFSGRFGAARAEWLLSELTDVVKAKIAQSADDLPGDTDVHQVFGVAIPPDQ